MTNKELIDLLVWMRNTTDEKFAHLLSSLAPQYTQPREITNYDRAMMRMKRHSGLGLKAIAAHYGVTAEVVREACGG